MDGDYRWIQPEGAPVGPQTVDTDANGFANFQWEPDPPNQNSNAVVTEELEDDFVGGPASCEILPPDGEAFFIEFADASEPWKFRWARRTSSPAPSTTTSTTTLGSIW